VIQSAYRRGARYFRQRRGGDAIDIWRGYVVMRRARHRQQTRADRQFAMHVKKNVFYRLKRRVRATTALERFKEKRAHEALQSGMNRLVVIWLRWLARRSKNNLYWAMYTWNLHATKMKQMEMALTYWRDTRIRQIVRKWQRAVKAIQAERLEEAIAQNQRQNKFLRQIDDINEEARFMARSRRIKAVEDEKKKAAAVQEIKEEKDTWDRRRMAARKHAEATVIIKQQIQERRIRRKEMEKEVIIIIFFLKKRKINIRFTMNFDP